MSGFNFKAGSLISFTALVLLLFIRCSDTSNEKQSKTKVSIVNKSWYFNDEIINPDSPAEGLLMNVRMVNAVFEDRGPELEKQTGLFDPEGNMQEFIDKIPEYVSNGVNAFTISLQGGMPGYEGAVNTAYNPDGSTREEYLQRVEKVIRACDANNAAVILTLFYQRQHSHESALTGKESIKQALENVIKWIVEKKFTNVLLEISNEYRHGGYRNWPDGDWLISEAGQVELINLAKELAPGLLVSTSGMGNGLFHDDLSRAADFLLIHFNNTSLEDYAEKINNLKKYDKPIVCNEDDKIKTEGAAGLALAVLNGSGWGYMNIGVNQSFPFTFSGIDDDKDVYRMFRKVTTPGYRIDADSLRQTAITIISPNDGDIFHLSEIVNIKLSHLYPDNSVPFTIELHANNNIVALVKEKLQVSWKPEAPETYILEAVVKTRQGMEIYRSPKVDIIVGPALQKEKVE